MSMIRTPDWLRDKPVSFRYVTNDGPNHYWELSVTIPDNNCEYTVYSLKVRHHYPEEQRTLWGHDECSSEQRCVTMAEWRGIVQEIEFHMSGGPPCEHDHETIRPRRADDDEMPGSCKACIEAAVDEKFLELKILSPEVKADLELYLGARWDALCQLVCPAITL